MGTPRTGKKIGNYLVCEQIGGGAMGRVWRGIDEALGRPVAVKMLRTELAEHPQLIERFRVEAQVLARLNHPNIATVFALLEDADELYLVMEYVHGETLHCLLERRGALDLDACFPLFHHALDGIHHAHEAGVVHRDIKASNLMIDTGGQVKWIDFGIARVHGSEGMTKTGGLMGTPEYMAPEQVRGEPGTIQSDIYSLGVLLFKVLTGRSPFQGDGEFDVMRAHVEADPPRPSDVGMPVGAGLEAVLLKALAKDPAERFVSALEFQDALVEAGAPEPVGTTIPPHASTEITLCEPSPGMDATRPDVGYDADPIAATVPDLPELLPDDAPEPPPTRMYVRERVRRSKLPLWVFAGLLLIAFGFGVNWIATLDPALEEGTVEAPAEPDPEIVHDPAQAETEAPLEESVLETEAEPARPARQGDPPNPDAKGWEIVR